jgi:hypothetical protein
MRFGAFFAEFSRRDAVRDVSRARIASLGVNDAPTRRRILHRSGTDRASVIGIFIISKPRLRLLRRSQSPLSGEAASWRQQGVVMGGSFDNKGGRAARALRS